jgi:hypothetical protein
MRTTTTTTTTTTAAGWEKAQTSHMHGERARVVCIIPRVDDCFIFRLVTVTTAQSIERCQIAALGGIYLIE